ncbi:MAG: TatD family hydrolase [Candidatus Thiodiazotropha taylori]|nr:TatD family hydrolase [Candidatus Thiodiazotropha taylori]MCW4310124.1 TatD family hydrolase [Candidatus Thiodiazotropha endolucinida]
MDQLPFQLNPFQHRAMVEFGMVTGFQVPEHVTLQASGNSPAILTHWAPVMMLMSQLEPHQQERVIGPFDVTREERQQLCKPPDAIDANCHLGQLIKELGLSVNTDPAAVFDTAVTLPGFEVNLRSAVLMHPDPEDYPSPERISWLAAQGFHVALGCSPKRPVTEATIHKLKGLLSSPDVAALGEIGVDHTLPVELWMRQTANAVRLFDCMPRDQKKVLVVKCRGMLDKDPSEAYDVLRATLQHRVSPVQLIHLQCFTGNVDVVKSWLETFPCTYFGFTKRVSEFGEGQVAALCSIEGERILLETYSPFFKFAGRKPSTPVQIGLTADAVAKVRGGTWRSVLAMATRNAMRLYRDRKDPDCDLTITQR